MNWYAIYVQSGKEEAIKRRIYARLGAAVRNCCVPKRKICERKSGIEQTVIRTMFPNYVFVQTKMDFATYYRLRSIPEIFHLLNYTNQKDLTYQVDDQGLYFKTIPEDEMASILNLIDGDEILDFSQIQMSNKQFVVLEGPLKGKEDRVKKLDKRKGRAKLSLDFFGAEKLIEVGVKFLDPRPDDGELIF